MNSIDIIQAKMAERTSTRIKVQFAIFLAILGMNLAYLIFVIPVFSEMFVGFGRKLPMPTQILIDLAGFVRFYLIYLLGPLVVVAVLSINFFKKLEKHKKTWMVVFIWGFESLILSLQVWASFLPIFNMAGATGN